MRGGQEQTENERRTKRLAGKKLTGGMGERKFFARSLFGRNFLEKQIRIGKNYFGNNFVVALGTIAVGINGNEPILSPKELDRDLKIMKSNGISDAVVFRLGGLNKKYIDVIKEYV
mgnify:CR=1 FL=1